MAVAPELIPAAEITLADLLIPLLTVASCLVGLAVASGADAFARALFGTIKGTVGWIPFVGKLVEQPIEQVAHKISNYIGGWEHYFDDRMGRAFHTLAQLVHTISRDTYDTGETLYFLARRIDSFLFHLYKGDAFKKHAARQAVTQSQTHALARTVHSHGERFTHTAPSTVLPRVKTLEGEFGHVIEWDLPRLRARTRTIEKSLDHLWKRVRGADKVLATGALIGAVALVLGKLGLGWLRCGNWKRAGRSVCGMDAGLLESLLADTLLIVGTLSLVEFAKEMQTVTNESARLVQGFWRVV